MHHSRCSPLSAHGFSHIYPVEPSSVQPFNSSASFPPNHFTAKVISTGKKYCTRCQRLFPFFSFLPLPPSSTCLSVLRTFSSRSPCAKTHRCIISTFGQKHFLPDLACQKDQLSGDICSHSSTRDYEDKLRNYQSYYLYP